MPKLESQPFKSKLNKSSDQFEKNKSSMLSMLEEIDALLDEAELGGGEHHKERLAKRGKLPVRERVFHFLDPDSPFLEISGLAAFKSDYPVGGGAIAGIGVSSGIECIIFANDPTVLAGAMHFYSVKKWMRAMQIARDSRLPFIQFVESAGGDLRPRSNAVVGGTTHFAESGRQFYEITELSKLNIPTVTVTFGTATAGGAYQPGMSDYNIFVKDQADVALAGPPLVQMATGEISDDETLGGAKMHSEISGFSDYLAENDNDAIRICRNVVNHLNINKKSNFSLKTSCEPAFDSEDLLGLFSDDLKTQVDIREVIMRIVDDSRFEEYKPLYDSSMVCGWANVFGYPIGILGNNGPIYPETAEKSATFIQLCNQTNTPIVFLHNVTGFLVGKEFERQAIIKKGSQLINAVSNSNVPHISFIIGASYGAGTYAMSGRAFNNRFLFTWPSAKIAVMGPKQFAGVMSLVRRAKAKRKGEKFDEKLDKQLVEMIETLAEKESLALSASSMVTDDGIIDPRDTRNVLGFSLSISDNNLIKGADGYGVFRL